MPPTLILIRHAEALHNLTPNHTVPDPSLTDRGRRQAAELREHLKTHLPSDRKVQLIVVSPMRRAIQTCLIALDWLAGKGVKIEPDARWQENYPKPCDTGTPISDLATEFPEIDFIGLDPVYPDKTSPAGARYHFRKHAILDRAQSALADLYSRAEDAIIVVSHSGFLRTAVAGRWFDKADYRIFDFAPREKENDPYRLVEWELTSGKGGMGRSECAEVELGFGLPE
ncbi:Phosphoglycerate mutase-like protein 1 [Madurella mycetomatis]|uniref:Phosphoglycerate mutase-like protein 1 n=1 Tax=Madurella mycetomatis TaxID=100816 RepID=A0A175W3K1_9PEZI|nr:Phosphoglycerate mutase-like protein 1 [Madurella mycetomatis]